MVLLYQTSLLTLTLDCPDSEWEKLPQESKDAIGKDIPIRVDDLKKKLAATCGPIVNEFFEELANSETGQVLWKKK